MDLSFEQALIEVWRQALVENAKTVELGTERYHVRSTPQRGLRQVDFVFEGKEIRGLEQNPQTKSRWAQLARSGKKVMQFLARAAAWQMLSMERGDLWARMTLLFLSGGKHSARCDSRKRKGSTATSH